MCELVWGELDTFVKKIQSQTKKNISWVRRKHSLYRRKARQTKGSPRYRWRRWSPISTTLYVYYKAECTCDVCAQHGVQVHVRTELNKLESHRGHTLLSKSLGHQHWVYTSLGRSCAVASLLLPGLRGEENFRRGFRAPPLAHNARCDTVLGTGVLYMGHMDSHEGIRSLADPCNGFQPG
jgi:hypothetical protein